MSTEEKSLEEFISKNKMGDEEFIDYVKNLLPQLQSRISDELSKEVSVEFDDVIVVYIDNQHLKFNVVAFNEVMALHNINLEDELVHCIVDECKYILNK